MAKYKITAPDGATFEVTAPDGASESEVMTFAQSQWKSEKAAPSAPMINSGAAADTLRDIPRYAGMAANSFATGAGDLVAGAGQLVSNLMPKSVGRRLGNAADRLAGGPGDSDESLGDRFDGYMRNREATYQADRGDYKDQIDPGRFTGSLVAGGAFGAGARAATLGGRIVQGSKAGGTLAASSPVDPDAGSYTTSKGIQVAGGVVAGGVAVPAVEGLVRAAGAAVNGIANAARGMKNTVTGQTSTAQIQQTLEAELQRAGLDWSQLPQSLKNSLLSQVQTSLKSGGSIDESAIRRLADFNKLNMTPTQAQITRDPLAFAREQNYSKLEVGKPLAERFTEHNQQMIGTVDRVRGGLGATAPDQYAAGQRVIENLRSVDASRRGTVDAAYTNARSQAGMDADVPLQPIAQRIGQLVEDFGEDKIPGAVMKRLQDFGLLSGKQTRVFNIREAEQLKTLISNNIDNPKTPTGAALTRLRASVDDAVNSLGDDAGGETAQAFRTARDAASTRFGQLNRTPGLKNAITPQKTVAPESFIDSYIVRGELQDVANLMRTLQPEARTEARAAVMDWIRSRAITGAEDTAKFSQSGFDKALKTLGERKLALIFAGDREALAQLAALRRVGAYVQSPPIASGVNHSNTATTGADFLDQFTRLPMMGLLGRPGDMIRASQVATSLNGANPTRAPQPLLPALGIQETGLLGARIASPAAAAMIPGLLDQPYKSGLTSRR